MLIFRKPKNDAVAEIASDSFDLSTARHLTPGLAQPGEVISFRFSLALTVIGKLQ